MEYRVNRGILLLAAVGLVILAGLAVTLWSAPTVEPFQATAPATLDATPPRVQPAGVPSNNTTPELASAAAATAFYKVDYQAYDAWLASLKTVSTADGYAILRHSIAPAVWPEIQKAHTVTPSSAITAQDNGLLLEGNSPIGGPWQIRTVKVSVDPAHLWPTMKLGTFDVLMMLAQEDGSWRFVSFVTEQQLAALKGTAKP